MSETHEAYVVDGTVYESAVKGRADFRQALREARPVIAAARLLRDKWRTAGQRVDSDDFYAAVHAVCEAADEYDHRLHNHPIGEQA